MEDALRRSGGVGVGGGELYGRYRRVCGAVSTEELVRFTFKSLRATEKGEMFEREEDVLWFARAAAAELERRLRRRRQSQGRSQGGGGGVNGHGGDVRRSSRSRALRTIGKLALHRCRFNKSPDDTVSLLVDIALDGIESEISKSASAAALAQDAALLGELAYGFSQFSCDDKRDSVLNARERILKTCCSAALRADAAAAAAALIAAVSPLLASVSAHEFTSVVMPAATRAMLRNPEIAAATTANILGLMAQSDTSLCATPETSTTTTTPGCFRETCTCHLTALLEAAKNTRDERRKEAVEVCSTLAQCIHRQCERNAIDGTETLRACVALVGDALIGQNGNAKATQWYQRAGLASLVGALAPHGIGATKNALTACDTSAIEALAAEAVEYVIESAEKDTNDEVRGAAISSMCTWLMHTSEPPTRALAVIDAALQSKEIFRRATYTYITSIRLLRNDERRRLHADAQRTRLHQGLCTLVKTGLVKVASRVDGLACACALFAMRTYGSPTQGQKDVKALDETLAAATAVDSIFLKDDFWTKLDVHGCKLVADFASFALEACASDGQVTSTDSCRVDTLTQSLRVLAAMAVTHSDANVRSYVSAALEDVTRKYANLREAAVDAVLQTLNTAREAIAGDAHDSSPGTAATVTICGNHVAMRIFSVLVSSHEKQTFSSPRHFVLLLLLSQHAVMSPSVRASCWKYVIDAVFDGEAAHCRAYAADNIVAVTEELFGDAGVTSALGDSAHAAFDVIRLLASGPIRDFDVQCILSHVVEHVRAAIDYASHESVSEDDVLIYSCQDGRPAIDYTMRATMTDMDGKKKTSQMLSTSTSTSSSDQHRCAEASRAAETVAQKMAAAAASSGGAKPSPQEVRREQQLASEAAVRACLRSSMIGWVRNLEVIMAVADGIRSASIRDAAARGDGLYADEIQLIDGYISTMASIAKPFLISKLLDISEGAAFVTTSKVVECILFVCAPHEPATRRDHNRNLAVEVSGALRWSLMRREKSGTSSSTTTTKARVQYPYSVITSLRLLGTMRSIRIPTHSFVTLLPIIQYALVTPSPELVLTSSGSVAGGGDSDADTDEETTTLAPTQIAVSTLASQLLRKAGDTSTTNGASDIDTENAAFYAQLPIPALVTSLLNSVQIMPTQRKSVCLVLNAVLEHTAAAAAAAARDGRSSSSSGSGDEVRRDALACTLRGLLYEEKYVRLMTLTSLCNIASINGDDDEYWDDDNVNIAIFMAKHDGEDDVRELATRLYEGLDYDVPERYFELLKPYVSNASEAIRTATCKALAAGLGDEDHVDLLPATITSLIDLYRVKIKTPTKVLSIRTRLSVARILRFGAAAIAAGGKGSVAPDATTEDDSTRDPCNSFMSAVSFIVTDGLADGNSGVYDEFMRAGAELVTHADLECCEDFLAWYKTSIDAAKPSGWTEKTADRVKRGSMPMIGAAAAHYPKGDARAADVVHSMIKVLATPSESVQRTVADTLVKVVASFAATSEDALPNLMQQLLMSLTQADSYGERRGAAFGIAACCKGCGISTLKKSGVMDALKAAVNDKKDARKREGALMAFECLCDRLGRLFEPYVIQILPAMLVAYGDGTKVVREATIGASRMIMKNLSAQGVKLVLPALLNGLEDKAWRTKQGSVQMLGAMAYCAPTQLSACLPQIVPQLGKVLGDTHPKVQQAAREALEQVGSVVQNPEVLSLVPSLLAAIADPTENTVECLDGIMDAVFAHTIDAPSLSLMIPVVSRGLRERSTDSKKKAVTIVSNMCSLVGDPKELEPYLDELMTEMRKVLIDPIPEMRAVAAKATAMLVAGIGLDRFEDLMTWLRATVKDSEDGVERSGAAQGLSEILAILPKNHIEEYMPTIFSGCKSYSIYEREGCILMLAYLPQTLQDDFAQYLAQALPCVLNGLADESESIRDVSLQAGKVFVRQFATTAQGMLIDAVLSGVFHSFWRIRLNSVQLLGDLMFLVAGVTGKIQTNSDIQDDGDSVSNEMNTRSIEVKLGTANRDATLSALYISRCDQNLQVRNSALHIWKSVVASTPKTLLEIIGALITSIIEGLSSHSNEDRTISCGGALRELVRKLGERVLPSVVPVFAERLREGDTSTRIGVCVGLVEVVTNSSKSQMREYLSRLMPTLRDALCDSEDAVREAAGSAFGSLLHLVGEDVLADVVPMLLAKIAGSADPESSAHALDGLRQIIRKHPYVLEGVLPSLTDGKLTANNANAIGALSQVAPRVISQKLKETLTPLLLAAGRDDGAGGAGDADASTDTSAGDDLRTNAETAASRVVFAVASQAPDKIVNMLVAFLRGEVDTLRCGAARVLARSMSSSAGAQDKEKQLSYILENHLELLASTCVARFHEAHAATLKAVWEAASAILAGIAKEKLPSYLPCLRDAVSLAIEHYRRRLRDNDAFADAARGASGALILPALSLPKALHPLLPVYVTTLQHGESVEERVDAAEAFSTLIAHTAFVSLKPSVVAMTGPLIRIFGERCASEVKAAVLLSLKALVQCAGIAVKPFVPQLQTTFLRCISDIESGDVRDRAGDALGLLMSMTTRVDSVVKELFNGVTNDTVSVDVQRSMMCSLRHVLEHGGEKVSQALLNEVRPIALGYLEDASSTPTSKMDESESASSSAAAAITGLCCHHVADTDAQCEAIRDIISQIAGDEDAGSLRSDVKIAMVRATAGIMAYASHAVVSNAELLQLSSVAIARMLQEESGDAESIATIRMSGIRSWSCLSKEFESADDAESSAYTTSRSLFKHVRRLLKVDNMQMRMMVCDAIGMCAQSLRAGLPRASFYLKEAIPSLTASIAAKNAARDISAERALFWCLRLDDGDSSFAMEYVKSCSASEKKVLTSQYVSRLVDSRSKMILWDDDEIQALRERP